ncbi:ferredoxin like protein [Thalassobacillus cyri]|uniref:Ferredoxin-like protein n=2 Tax=Thalassobacillus cyri TaxID=571932 RepID=A0A1H4GPC1_9BACI|nr:ferredoxin like protein [Thalassobacillus cyri]
MEGDEIMTKATIEEKQYLVRFKADKESHLKITDQSICLENCPDKPCTYFCPGEVYKFEGNRIQVGYEGCHECGSCRIGCPQNNIEWKYPKGGHGVIFQLA